MRKDIKYTVIVNCLNETVPAHKIDSFKKTILNIIDRVELNKIEKEV